MEASLSKSAFPRWATRGSRSIADVPSASRRLRVTRWGLLRPMNRFTQIVAAGLLASVLGLSACDPGSDSTQVIARVVSPDGRRDAVHAQDLSGGATVASIDEVFVVDRGAPLRMSERVATLERVCRLDVRWLDNDLVEITYFARRAVEDRSVSRSASVGVRYRWLGQDAANGC